MTDKKHSAAPVSAAPVPVVVPAHDAPIRLTGDARDAARGELHDDILSNTQARDAAAVHCAVPPVAKVTPVKVAKVAPVVVPPAPVKVVQVVAEPLAPHAKRKK